MNEFENKVALVTGGNSGIGLEVVKLFIKNKMKVAILSDQTHDGIIVADIMKESGGNAIFIEVDIRKEVDVEHALELIVGKFGRLDIAVNSIDIKNVQTELINISRDEWDNIINTNLTGTWLSMKNEIKEMKKSSSGVIVNISSISGKKGTKHNSAYVSSSHGIMGLTKAAALECGTDNIRINTICAGIIETEMIQNMSIEELKKSSENTPLERIGQPEEVAEAVLWLCSEKASFITGQSINVDGGITAK